MKQLGIFFLVFMLVVTEGVAQNEFDVLRYSSTDNYGGARFNAMGGSFGALGANMAGLSVNPGGLGVYKGSDFSFTPAFHYNYSESYKNENSVSDGKLNLHFSNLGLVVYIKGESDWKSVNLAFGYNRTSNYNTSISIKSQTNASFLNEFTTEVNANGGTHADNMPSKFPFSSNLAYQTYLVNPLVTDSMQYNHIFSNSSNLTQLTNYETRGGAGELYFALGTNYDDKLYIGALIGIPRVNYVYDRNYTETAESTDTLTEYTFFSVNDFVQTSGEGLNLKLGLIYKVADWFRLGAAFHTPTVYSLSDNWVTTVASENKTGEVLRETSPSGKFEYVVTTPYGFVSSAAVILGKHGVINGDYEIVNYSTARVRQSNTGGFADFSNENQRIKDNFRLNHKIRVGTEWRLDPFRLRVGYRYQGNPLKDGFTVDNSSSIYSFGWGVKKEGYYFDMAYSLKLYKAEAAIVEAQDNFAAVNLKDHYASLTLGFRF